MHDTETAERIAQLKVGVHYRYGTRRPYRPAPIDFRETFIRIGWEDEIMEIYHASSTVIKRWIDECGGDELLDARSQVSGVRHQPQRRTKMLTYSEAVAALQAGADLTSLESRRKPPKGTPRQGEIGA
ncbi:hypothetical protein [Sphingomonas kyungheensis]|uniref:Transposase n=1 Tax=Sphingomonas kyungheensis TaxID=1069987 RepID=A0ABU8H459_9SPHN